MLDAQNRDAETVGIREFHNRVSADGRVESVMVHVGDGLPLARDSWRRATGQLAKLGRRQNRVADSLFRDADPQAGAVRDPDAHAVHLDSVREQIPEELRPVQLRREKQV